MKKRLLSVALLMSTSFVANAQVGVGTATPNKSAELTVVASNRGILIPNVALTSATDKTTITNGNVQSLMVYATETSKTKDITPGYYYWDINKWVRLTADKDIAQIVVNNFQEILNLDNSKVENLIKNIINKTEGNVIYEGDKLYHINKEGKKEEIKDKLTSIAYDDATGDYIYYNENAVDRNGKIIGEGVRIKVKETVINKFGDIINNKTVQEHITNYLDGTHVGGNVYYDGDKLTYVTKEGERKEVSINEVVTANESKTAIITVNDKQYYVSEEYLAANKGVLPTSIDPKKLPKGIYLIDVVGGVVNNFEEIVNNGPITVDGRTYPTINDYITNLTETTGGFTKIVYDQTTGDVIFQEWDASTNSWVNVDNSKFETIVKGNESQTTIITVNDKQYYVSEAYLAANDGVVPTTIDAANLPAGIYAIDVVGGVVNNFEEIVNNGPITVDGNTYPTINDYITHLTETTGGFTKIVYDQTTGDVIFQEWDASTNSWVNVDNSKFETIVKGNESQTTIITVNDKQYYVSEAYLAANDGVVPTTVDATNLPAGIYAIDVVGGVVNNFEEIVNNGPITVDGRTYPTINDYITHLTETTGGFTKIVYDQTTGDVIFQEWDASTNSWVNVDNSKFETIVKGNESQTTIITVNDKQYYVSEAYLAANDGVVPTTVDATNLPAGIYAIDVVGGVVNNFEEIVNNGPITVDGRTYPTINDYITHLTETTGGFTKIVYDQTTGDVIFQEWDASTNSWVNVDNSKFETIVKANETVTVLKKNANGTFTYYNEEQIGADGQPKAGETGVTIDPKEVSVALNPATNVYEFKNSKGDVIGAIDANAKAISFDNSTNGFTSNNVQEALEELKNTIATNKGDLSVAGGLEFTGTTDGTAKLLADAGIQIADGGVTTDKIGDKAVTSEKLDGGQGAEGRVGVAGADGTITYKTLDEVVKANETVTLLVSNTDGTFTYYNEEQIGADGQPKAGETGVTIDPKEVSVALNPATNVYEFKNSKGDVIGAIDANANAITYNDNSTQLGVTNVQGAIEKLLEKITTVEGTKGDLSVAGGLEFTGTTDGTAKLLADAGIQIADGGVTTDKIGDKAVTSEKLDGGQGAEGRVGIAGADGTITYKTLDEVVKANETVTLLVSNTDGTFTYYNEEQIGADGQPKAGETGVTIDPKEVSVALNPATNVYEFKNSKGDVIGAIDANANAITYNDNSTQLGVTNVQGAIEKLLEKITTVEGTKGDLSVAGGLEFTGTTDGTAKLLADAGIQIADGGVTTDKIGDKAVTSEKLDGGQGAEGRVGVAGADGTITYKTLDEVVKANETVTLLVSNTDGTFTYYNEEQIGADGQPKAGETGVTIDPKEVSVALNPATNVYEFKNSKGDVIGAIDANAKAISFDNSTNGFTSNNVQEALEELKNTIATNKGDLSVAGGLEFTGTTDGTAKLLADAGIQIADGGVTTDKIGDKAVTSEKLDGGQGAEGRVGVAGADGTITYKTLDEVVKANETVTLLVSNTDGTFTYYNEEQIGADGQPKAGETGVTIDPKEVSVALNPATNVYEFKNSKGDVIGAIDANAKAISFDNSTNGFTSNNVQEALEELKNTIATNKGDLSVAGGLEFTGTTDGTAKLLADAGIQIADGGVTTDKIKPGNNGEVLVTEGIGDAAKTKWVSKESVTSNTLVTNSTDLVSTVNGVVSKLTLEGDVILKEGKTVVNAIQGTLVSETKPSTNGQALIYNTTTKQWEPGTPAVTVDKVTDAKTLTTDGVIVIGADSNATATTAVKSLLADVRLNIAKEKITTDHIKNGTIKPEDIAKAGNNQVLVTNESGDPTWKNQTEVGEIVTANNGLTKTNDSKIQLGGALIKPTVINTENANTLALTGLDKKKTQGISATEGVTQHLLAVDKNGDVIKALKAAMPKFFYMPSVMVPTAESQATQIGVSYSNATRKGTIDLYAIYKKQFGTPVMSSPGASVLPVLPASELGFHVTYATEGVFTIESVTAEGLMTYEVSATANVNVGSFINIVFSVKED